MRMIAGSIESLARSVKEYIVQLAVKDMLPSDLNDLNENEIRRVMEFDHDAKDWRINDDGEVEEHYPERFYRLLNEGEQIEEGDEYFDGQVWRKSEAVGTGVGDVGNKIYRRDITPSGVYFSQEEYDAMLGYIMEGKYEKVIGYRH